MNTELYNEILEGIANNDYTLVDSMEETDGVYLTISCEGDKVIVSYEDTNNDLMGAYALESCEVLKMSFKEFESALGNIYYYNCNIPM